MNRQSIRDSDLQIKRYRIINTAIAVCRRHRQIYFAVTQMSVRRHVETNKELVHPPLRYEYVAIYDSMV